MICIFVIKEKLVYGAWYLKSLRGIVIWKWTWKEPEMQQVEIIPITNFYVEDYEKGFQKVFGKIGRKLSTLEKACLLGTARILRRVRKT